MANYVVARSRGGHATLQHRVTDLDPRLTQCGLDLTRWPWRVYSKRNVPIVTCRRCVPTIDLDQLRWPEED